MPLGGNGGPLGNVLASAVGAPSAAAGFFEQVGTVIAAWAPENIQVLPGTMAATGGAVSGSGSFERLGNPQDLGNRLADALTIPSTATDARAKWVAFAGAFLDHLENYGVADGTGLSSGSPCTGAGTIRFSVGTFVPPLADAEGVEEPVAAALLEAFGAMLLNYIQTNGQVVAISLSGAPLSAPTDGPVSWKGTIA